ncbi:MAG: class I SAM-dependent methyltransferase [Myxococcales bacterium]|nr:class I SAM-dependent methyltransferase [Myxococcales bacterium]
MGRRGVRVEDADRWVFNRLADAYRLRPGYPDVLVDRLAAIGGGPRERVADLGAGTGHLAIALAQRGQHVAAVEPARAMLDELIRGSRHLAPTSEAPSSLTLALTRGSVRTVHASAEHTTLESHSFGLVLFADVLQWVDPELAGLEAARLLSPAGACALVEARLGDSSFARGLGAILARYNPKATRIETRAGRQLLSLATGGAGREIERFAQEVELSPEVLEATLRSFSYVGPALGPRNLESLLSDVRALAREHPAVWSRELTLTWARPGRL